MKRMPHRLVAALALVLVASPSFAEHRHRRLEAPAKAPAAAPPAKSAPAAAAKSGADVPLMVNVATPGAGIFVDGMQIGVSPLDLPVPVAPGNHSLKVSKLGFAPYIDVFQTAGKREVKLEIELVPVSGVLHVKSNVAGARVLVDGKYVGDVPAEGSLDVEAEVGPRAVQVAKGACYKEFFNNFMAVAGQEITVEANIEEMPADNNPCKPLPTPEPKWYQKKWVWGVVAGAAVLAAGGVTAGVLLGTRDPLGDVDKRFDLPANGVLLGGF